MNQYIKVGGKIISAEDLCKILGIAPESGMKVSVGQNAVGGAFEASVLLGVPKSCAFAAVEFCPDGSPAIRLSHSEKDFNEVDGGEPPVRTFLYDQADGYVSYLNHKICPKEELGDGVLHTQLIASGDTDVIVDVYQENQHVEWHDLLST